MSCIVTIVLWPTMVGWFFGEWEQCFIFVSLFSLGIYIYIYIYIFRSSKRIL